MGVRTDGAEEVVGHPAQRVLIVDDRPEIRQLLQTCFILDRDIEIVGEAADGCSAVQMVRTLLPDAVILDLEMPVLSGDKAIPLIRDASPRTQIIVYSGSTESCLYPLPDATPDAFVPKGGSLNNLVSTLHALASSPA